MFTGKLEGISRAEAKSLIEKNSGKIISNVSKKLNFLVVGQKPTNRKVNEAKNLNIKVINQKELIKMIKRTTLITQFEPDSTNLLAVFKKQNNNLVYYLD